MAVNVTCHVRHVVVSSRGLSRSTGRSINIRSDSSHVLNFRGDCDMMRSKMTVSGQNPPLRCLCTAEPDSSVQSHEFEELDGENFWETMKMQPRDQLNVVICYTSKCMPCKLCKPIMAEWEQELKQMNKMARFYQFALTMPNKDTALAMDVRSSPTFLVIRDGSIVKRAKGKVNLDEIKSYVFANAV